MNIEIQILISFFFFLFNLKNEKWNVLKQISYETTVMVIIFWDFLMFDQIFLSLQVKRSVIISNKHDTYELPNELPNNL